MAVPASGAIRTLVAHRPEKVSSIFRQHNSMFAYQHSRRKHGMHLRLVITLQVSFFRIRSAVKKFCSVAHTACRYSCKLKTCCENRHFYFSCPLAYGFSLFGASSRRNLRNSPMCTNSSSAISLSTSAASSLPTGIGAHRAAAEAQLCSRVIGQLLA